MVRTSLWVILTDMVEVAVPPSRSGSALERVKELAGVVSRSLSRVYSSSTVPGTYSGSEVSPPVEEEEEDELDEDEVSGSSVSIEEEEVEVSGSSELEEEVESGRSGEEDVESGPSELLEDTTVVEGDEEEEAEEESPVSPRWQEDSSTAVPAIANRRRYLLCFI